MEKSVPSEQLITEGESNGDINTFATGASISLVGSVGGRGLFFLSQIFLARWLGPEVYGLYAIGWTTLRISSLLTPLGLDKGVVRIGAEFVDQKTGIFKKVAEYSLGIAGLAGVTVGLALFIMAPAIEEAFAKPGLADVIRIIAVAIPFYAILKVANGATTITHKMQYSVYSEHILQPASNFILIAVVFLVGGALVGATTAVTVSFILATILSLYFVRRLFPQLKIRGHSRAPLAKTLLLYSLPMALADTFTLSIVWMDQLFIGYFLPSDSAGIYQAVIQSSVVFALILGSITAIFSPMIATMYSNNEIGRLEELYRVATKWGFYLNLPLLLVIAVASRELLTTVFGGPYGDGWLPLRILLIGQAINVLTGTVVPLLTMTGHQNRWFVISGFMFSLNFVLNLFLIPRLGLTGAAIGTACAISGLYLLALFQVRSLLGIWPYDRRHLSFLLVLLPTLLVMLVYRYFYSVSSFWDIVAYFIIAFGSAGIFILLRGLDSEETQILVLFKERIRGSNRKFSHDG